MRILRTGLLTCIAAGLLGPAAASAVAFDLAGVWDGPAGAPLVRVDETPPGTFEGRVQIGISDGDCSYVSQQAIWNDVKPAGNNELLGKAIVFSRGEPAGCVRREVNAWYWLYPGGKGNGLRVCVPESVGPGHEDDAPAIDRTSPTGLTGLRGCTDFFRKATRADLTAKRVASTYVGPITRRNCKSSHGLVEYFFKLQLSRTAVPADPIETFRIYFRGHRVRTFSNVFRSGTAGSVISFANLVRKKPATVRVVVETTRGRTLTRTRFFPACLH